MNISSLVILLFAGGTNAGTQLTVAWIGLAGAVIVALVSACVSIWSLIKSRENSQLLAEHQARLEERKSRQSARIEYEYEARQRLYRECDPLLFQLGELIDYGRGRIFSLARSASRGELDGPNSFLGGPGYYMESTMYSLLVPITIYTLLQRRLTFLDFSLEPTIRLQYEVLKFLYLSFTEDFELANREPRLPYDPNNTNWQALRSQDERVYWRQGIPFGRQDAALNSLIAARGKGPARYLSFGEFETGYRTNRSEIQTRFAYIYDVFLGFHPERRPVLWRTLIAQLYYYEVLRRLQRAEYGLLKVTLDQLVQLDTKTAARIDWRRPGGNVSDATVREPLYVASAFVKENLKPFVTPDLLNVSD